MTFSSSGAKLPHVRSSPFAEYDLAWFLYGSGVFFTHKMALFSNLYKYLDFLVQTPHCRCYCYFFSSPVSASFNDWNKLWPCIAFVRKGLSLFFPSRLSGKRSTVVGEHSLPFHLVFQLLQFYHCFHHLLLSTSVSLFFSVIHGLSYPVCYLFSEVTVNIGTSNVFVETWGVVAETPSVSVEVASISVGNLSVLVGTCVA